MTTERHIRLNDWIMSITAMITLLCIAFLMTDLAFVITGPASLTLIDFLAIIGITAVAHCLTAAIETVYKHKRQTRRQPQARGHHHAHR